MRTDEVGQEREHVAVAAMIATMENQMREAYESICVTHVASTNGKGVNREWPLDKTQQNRGFCCHVASQSGADYCLGSARKLVLVLMRPPQPLRSLSVTPPILLPTHTVGSNLNLIWFAKLFTNEGGALVEAPVSRRW